MVLSTLGFLLTSLLATKFHNRYLLLWLCVVQILLLINCSERVVGCELYPNYMRKDHGLGGLWFLGQNSTLNKLVLILAACFLLP